MQAEGCIFVDTNECCSFVVDGKCIGMGTQKLMCLFSHPHTIVDPKKVDTLKQLLVDNIQDRARNKILAGLPGRQGLKDVPEIDIWGSEPIFRKAIQRGPVQRGQG